MKLSVIIPVYNEKGTILEILKRVQTVPLEKEIIVVDDGSTDGTRETLKKVPVAGDIKIIFQEKNLGKGAAVRRGLKEATGDLVIFQDADLELDPRDITILFKAWAPHTPVVYGSRFLGRKNKMPFHTWIANRFLTLLTNILFQGGITDMETCYKLCSRDILLSLGLTEDGFGIEPEITCKLLKKGYRIKEVPVSYQPRRKGKKINWRDGLRAVYYLFKYRLGKC